MIKTPTIYSILKRLLPHITKKKSTYLLLIIILTILSTIFDTISLGAILPFLTALINPVTILESSFLKPFVLYFNISNQIILIKFMTISIIILIIFSTLFKWLTLFFQIHISNSITSDLCIKAYKNTLYQPYLIHVNRNSSNVIAGVSKVNMILVYILNPIINISTAVFTIIIICFALFYIEPLITFELIFTLILIYLITIIFTKKPLIFYGEKRNQEMPKLTKAIQEGLGGIRDVLIDGTQELYCEIFNKSEKPIKQANAKIQLISQTPGIIIQSLTIIIIILLSFYLSNNENGFIKTIPILAALVLGIQRMVPSFQNIFNAWSTMKSGIPTMLDVLNYLEQPMPSYLKNNNSPISFRNEILLNNVSFKYSTDAPNILKNLQLKIKKGTKTGLFGITGSGKSTILDIIMALLEPTEGNIQIDNVIIDSNNFRNWQKHIAHVPQSIYLTDSTIAENIAFGVNKKDINYERLYSAAKKASILTTIENMPEKFNTFVGERGVRLSGGQRQRIGIARALYKNADVIIFDEATSALDHNTEKEVMDAIDNLENELTIIMVAHRLSTLRNCNKIFEFKEDNIIIHENYKSIII
jgi:ABC-type multidrug transport system fused ATPase/permease subunit